MKKLILLVFVIILSGSNGMAQLKSRVDERFEVTSIAFRLAGAEEYMTCNIPAYSLAIDAYFGTYKNHPLIEYIKEIREGNNVAYDAVSTTAFSLVIDNGSVRLNPKIDIELLLLNEPRFTKETLNKYISLLNSFYSDTDFPAFFDSQTVVFREAENSMNELLRQVNHEWFESFFGLPLGTPEIYISLTNGQSNYALQRNELSGSVHGILMGSFCADTDGKPTVAEDILEIVIHELCHQFSNPITKNYLAKLQSAGEIIFPHVEKMLSYVGYGDIESMFYECFNNLFVNMYYKECNPEFETIALYMAGANQNHGFIWMDRLVRFMDNFYSDRILYRHVQDFMPQLVSYIDAIAKDINVIVKEYNQRYPYIISTYPADGSIINPNITEIRIMFSREMNDSAGFLRIGDENRNTPEVEPLFPPKWRDKQTHIIPLAAPLKPNTKYGFIVPKIIFQSVTGHSLQENYEVRFKTSDNQ